MISVMRRRSVLASTFAVLFLPFLRSFTPQIRFQLGSTCKIQENGYSSFQSGNNRCMSSTSSSESIPEVFRLNVIDFSAILKNEDLRSTYQIIDVRDPSELQAVSLPGGDIINLPLSTANEWSSKVSGGSLLDSDKPTVCICHHGMRSLRVANFLVGNAGFKEVYNVEGGIHQYAVKVDPSIGTY